ncbi:MAG: hypothetical protein Q8R38_04330 [Candidatus Omnitrophota bacterium]|nr:hypothetical protein [Candidatus Omnitrophota bacterium]
MAKISHEPRLRQYLVLAYQIQEMLDSANALSAKQISEWLHMTPPRVSQILNLLFLSPAIQKEILLSNDEKIRNLTEHKILAITKEIEWEKQQVMWNDLLK